MYINFFMCNYVLFVCGHVTLVCVVMCSRVQHYMEIQDARSSDLDLVKIVIFDLSLI